MSKIKTWLKKLFYPNNYDSQTYINYIRKHGGVIGDECVFYDPINIKIDTTSCMFLEMGNNVQITSGCRIILHDYSYSVLGNAFHDLPRAQRKTIIGNNVFVGMGSILLMGCNIGDNVIIGAGSVVRGTVESNSVYAGNPARKICTLEEHYLKCRKNFENSARCYATQMKRKNGTVDVDDMGIYRRLFVNDEEMSEYINNSDFKAISCDTKSKIRMDYVHYDSIDSLLSKD